MGPFVRRIVRLVDDLVERVFPRIRCNPQLAYPIALLIFSIAAVLRVLLSRWLPPSLPFITFFVAVLLTTLVAGTGPGVLVIGLSVVFGWYFYFAPMDNVGAVESLLAIGLFAFLSGLMVAVAHLLNRKVEGLLDERARNEALLQDSALVEMQLEQMNIELRHRLKNTFAVISGLITQSARYSRDITTFAGALSGRLSAMGLAMDLIATRNFQGALLGELISDTLKPLVPPGVHRIEIKGPEVIVPGDIASALGLTLHELGTNAIKYGAWSNDRGFVSVRWNIDSLGDEESRFELVWAEQGGPEVTAPERQGLGTILIDSGFPAAKVERAFTPDGVRCRIVATFKQTTSRRTRGRASVAVG
jgi:two-component sensor histidine kinase